MIYGKATCAIESEHGRLHLTVTGNVVSLKQNNDLIRLTLDETRELAQDLMNAIDLLEKADEDDWQDISTAPKDGSKVWVRRKHNGNLVQEGWSVWGVNSLDAPIRQWGDGGLYGSIPPDEKHANTPRWLTPDRRYSFPTPTEWHPSNTHSNNEAI